MRGRRRDRCDATSNGMGERLTVARASPERNSALVGPVDEELDAKLDLSGTRALPLKPIKF